MSSLRVAGPTQFVYVLSLGLVGRLQCCDSLAFIFFGVFAGLRVWGLDFITLVGNESEQQIL